jgi:hypothetical protein
MKPKNKRINLFFSYSWRVGEEPSTGLSNNSHKAFIEIRNQLNNKIKDNEKQYDFKRLRGTAGKNILDNISHQIQIADLLIFDITSNNPNVMIELGMALASKSNEKRKTIFLICEEDIKKHLPSNMSGYFVSKYTFSEKECTFNDNGSLIASLSSEIKSLIWDRNNDRFTEEGAEEIGDELEE